VYRRFGANSVHRLALRSREIESSIREDSGDVSSEVVHYIKVAFGRGTVFEWDGEIPHEDFDSSSPHLSTSFAPACMLYS